MQTTREGRSGRPAIPWHRDPWVRGLVYQALTLIVVVVLGWYFVHNTAVNLEKRTVAHGFSFLSTTAGFDISQTPIDYPKDASYGRALMVGLANTALVAVIGIVVATIVGFLVGIGRLSKNFVVSRLCTAYVETLRNIPVLLQIFFWYFAVLGVMPLPRNSLQPIPGWVYVNNRGLYLPEFHFGGVTGWAIAVGFLSGLLGAIILAFWAKKRQIATGRQFPTTVVGLALIVGLPVLAFALTGFDLTLVAPKKGTFNVTGGTEIIASAMALTLALALYTAAFIAEVVRGGILAVAHGQTEAARSLGLSPNQTLRLVVVPQAMRVIVPPLTNQYLNLTKNSSLAVGIGYPDLVSVGGIVLNQSGQAIEVIAIWMAIYLSISVGTSLLMNAWDRANAIVER